MTETPRGLVLHIAADDHDRILGAIASARNAIAALGDDLNVEIVAQGGCVIGAASGSEIATQVSAALEATPNVSVHLCAVAAKGNGITSADDIIDRAYLTETATAHCARRQFAGWAYVRG